MALRAYERGLLAMQRRAFEEAREQLALAGPDDRALLLLGQLASAGHGEQVDPVRARELYERAAELGSAEAAHNLGVLYATGRGVAEDQAAALRWYQRSAELGYGPARRMVGLMYATGQGAPVDQDAAERHWRMAAAAGEAQALHDLGALFAYHRVNLPEAASWYLEAAKAGIEAAERELALLAPKLRLLASVDPRARTMLGVIRAFHLGDPAGGVKLLAVSAEGGDPVAQRTLGYLVQHGVGTAKDDVRANALYQAAAEQGDAFAAFNLGVLSGGSDEAVHWLRQAADAGVVEAYSRLGDRLSERDLDEEALRWYVRGAEAGDKGSMFAAACWYRDGFGGPVDLVQALRWYLAMLNVDSGDGIHEAHAIVPRMTTDEIHEAGRLSGRLLEADLFVQREGRPSAASD
ncbi:tetratricopeptide repeat protein [Micromonospora avicenniae]|uniref:tetratricopeptide repeat protein n=1 Tax=Micromonospora avicenniae TaxID=1198245 RepID=UPI00158F3580|nr:tetratricopeptide repeat protein [Micromonospora avicenniae]